MHTLQGYRSIKGNTSIYIKLDALDVSFSAVVGITNGLCSTFIRFEDVLSRIANFERVFHA